MEPPPHGGQQTHFTCAQDLVRRLLREMTRREISESQLAELMDPHPEHGTANYKLPILLRALGCDIHHGQAGTVNDLVSAAQFNFFVMVNHLVIDPHDGQIEGHFSQVECIDIRRGVVRMYDPLGGRVVNETITSFESNWRGEGGEKSWMLTVDIHRSHRLVLPRGIVDDSVPLEKCSSRIVA